VTALRFGSATDVGLVRTNNEDRYLVDEPLFAVADGMGGHAAGEVASATAVESLKEEFTEHTPRGLAAAARAANRAVWEEAQASPDLRGMGTTLVALALVGGPDHEQVAVVNVGDSRIYRLHRGELVQLTSDHSLVGQMVASGAITPEEAEVHPRRNVLTRALGVDPEVDVDLVTVEIEEGDRYLLCSDGLPRELSDDEMASLLRRLTDPGEAAQELVDQARQHGGSDNVTVVIIDLVDDQQLGESRATDAANSAKAHSHAARRGEEPTTALEVNSRSHFPRLGWWERRRIRKNATPISKMITLRVVAFFALLIALVLVAFGGIAYYARQSYFVGLDGKHLVIFQGRPGGVLWFQPTIAERSAVTTAGVLPVHWSELRAGKTESSMDSARAFVTNLHREYKTAKSADSLSSTNTSTTVLPTTTGVPASTVPTVPVTTAQAAATTSPTTTHP
jgi:PPM family protein phosphatase